MATADAVVSQSLGIQVAVAAAEQARSLALYLVGEVVRLFSVPCYGCLLAYDADTEAELLAGVDAARPDVADRAVVILHDGHCVVLEQSALYEGLLGAHQTLDVQVRADDLGQVYHMRADVAHGECRTCLFRVNAPCLRLSLLLNGYVVAAVCELHVDDADLAEVAAGNHLARLLDHLVAGVTVGYEHDLAGLLDELLQLLRLLGSEAQRLLAVYV